MQEFKNSELWKRAHALAMELYKETAEFPDHEGFGLSMQICRAGTATATRIAESCNKDEAVEVAADLRRAKSSVTEVEYLLVVARDLEYVKVTMYNRLALQAATLRKAIHASIKKA